MINSETTNDTSGHKQIPVWKNPSFWHITALMAACSVFYYMDVIINYAGWVNLRWGIFYTVHDLHRAFFLIPVMYAAYAFRLKGALVTSVVSFLVFLPRALFVSPFPDPLLRAIIFIISMSIIGVFLSSLLESINKRRELEQDLSQAQNELLQKAMEEALCESEDRYKRLIDNIPDIIFTIDLEGRITFVSKRTQEILGYENAETINMNIFNFIPEEDRQRAMENLQKGMKGEKIKHFQIPLITKSGEIFIFECSFARIYKDGAVIGAQGTAVDITERKQVESELRDAELKFRTIFDQASDGILLAEKGSSSFYMANNKICEMLGYTQEEIIKIGLSEIHSEKDLPYVIKQFERMGKNEISVASDIPVMRKDGSIFYADINSSSVNLGGKDYLIGVFRDITERKRTREALRQSEERYRRITENMSDFVSELDPQGIFKYNSPSVRRILGYDPEELIGSCAFDLVHPEDREHVMARYMEGVNTLSDREVEQRYRCKDGTYIWLRSSGRPIYGADGKNIGMIVNSNDISERKQAEDALRESEAKFKRLYDSNIIGVIFWDTAGNITQANDEFLRTVGYTGEDIRSGKVSWKDMTPPEYAYLDENSIKEMAKTDICTPFEKEYIRKDGSRVPIRLNAAFLKGDKKVGICFIQDISERKKAEENIIKLSLRQQALLDAIPDIIVEVDTNKIYTWANETGKEFFGKDVVGKEASFYFVWEQNTFDIVEPLFKGSDEIIYLESWQRRKDGQERLLAWWCRVLKDKQGNVIGAISSARDITEIRQTEEEIKRLNEELEQRVANRTAELATKAAELERMNKTFVDRELRMRELKERIAELEKNVKGER